MKHTFHLPIVGLLLLLVSPAATWAQKGADSSRWEKEIAAYEAQDKTNPPPKGQILFIGASTVRRWTTLAQDFPDCQVINRGFGGSQIVDSTYFAERLIFPHAPRQVFLRAGGNDLNAGKPPQQVFTDFKDFVAKVHGKLPETEIVFLAQTPSISRWKQADKEQALNTMVRDFVAGKPHLKYVEMYEMVLGADGQPRPELFVEDKLHFNAEGYKLLADRVRPHLAK
jgi:lysophospholipase L1-like esterase